MIDEKIKDDVSFEKYKKSSLYTGHITSRNIVDRLEVAHRLYLTGGNSINSRNTTIIFKNEDLLFEINTDIFYNLLGLDFCLPSKINKLEKNILDNFNSINEKNELIMELLRKIDSFTEKIETNENNIRNNKDSICQNTQNIQHNIDKIDQNIKNIDYNKETIKNNKDGIESNRKYIDNNSIQITDIKKNKNICKFNNPLISFIRFGLLNFFKNKNRKRKKKLYLSENIFQCVTNKINFLIFIMLFININLLNEKNIYLE